jgi:hypothetical protein
MRSVLARRLALTPSDIHPAVWSFAQECNGLLARLVGYMGALALVAIVLVSLVDELGLVVSDSAAKWDWGGSPRLEDSNVPAGTYEPNRLDGQSGRPVSLLGLRGAL